jgi:hypothetical protein
MNSITMITFMNYFSIIEIFLMIKTNNCNLDNDRFMSNFKHSLNLFLVFCVYIKNMSRILRIGINKINHFNNCFCTWYYIFKFKRNESR